MVPVGGFFTIDATTAGKVCNQLKPKIIIPMHFKTAKINFPISDVEPFLKDKGNVTRSNHNEIELKTSKLPNMAQIIVLKQSL